MDVPRNMTGLYLGGFIQEGYLPPRERRSTIPSTFYRGHVVKLARAPNSNPHRSSVGRYPMHSLNSGFTGLKVPIKDQMYFKVPEERKNTNRVRGRWTNYPMTIEVRKNAGHGSSGTYLAECVLSGVRVPYPTEENFQGNESRVGSSLLGASPAYRDKDEERFYQSMYDEIRQVVADQEETMLTNRHKLERILLNDSENSIQPDIVSPAHEARRVHTSYGVTSKPSNPESSISIKRPHTTLPSKHVQHGSLLLPVPIVTKRAWGEKHSTDTAMVRLGSVSPWLPRVTSCSPYAQRNKKISNIWTNPETLPPSNNCGNIGLSTADRLHRLLDAADDEENAYTASNLSPVRSGQAQEHGHGNLHLTQSASALQPSLSVVVPASYQEPPSLPPTPIPPEILVDEKRDFEEKLIKSPRESKFQKLATISPKVTNMLFTTDEVVTEDLNLVIGKSVLLCNNS